MSKTKTTYPKFVSPRTIITPSSESYDKRIKLDYYKSNLYSLDGKTPPRCPDYHYVNCPIYNPK